MIIGRDRHIIQGINGIENFGKLQLSGLRKQSENSLKKI
jgi:hypothetical protein